VLFQQLVGEIRFAFGHGAILPVVKMKDTDQRLT